MICSSPGSTTRPWGSPRRPAQRATWRGSAGGPHSAGGMGPKSTTEGVPVAVAMWATPVSPDTSRPAAAIRAARSTRLVAPATTADRGSPARRATSSARARSSPTPVTRTVRPAAASLRATAAKRSAGQRRASLAAPGWTTVAPVASGRGGAGRSPRWMSPGSEGMPLSVSMRHQRATSCSSGLHSGCPTVASRPGERNDTRRPGCRSSSTCWLSGPRPCRSTATSGRRRPGWRGPRSGVSATSSMPVWATSSEKRPGAASTRRWSGKVRASARNAGMPVRKSPSLRARRTSTVGRPAGVVPDGPVTMPASRPGPGCGWWTARPGRGGRPPGPPRS